MSEIETFMVCVTILLCVICICRTIVAVVIAKNGGEVSVG